MDVANGTYSKPQPCGKSEERKVVVVLIANQTPPKPTMYGQAYEKKF